MYTKLITLLVLLALFLPFTSYGMLKKEEWEALKKKQQTITQFVDVEDQNLSGESSGSNFSDEFKELTPFHEYLGSKTHDSVDFQILKEKYLNDILGGFILNKLKSETEFYKTLSEKKHTIQTVKSILEDIHKIAILAYDETALSKKNCDANSIGIYRHTFCASFLNECIKKGFLEFLKIESSYKDKALVLRNTVGSVRPDVYWQEIGHVFDFKFLGADVKKPQQESWSNHLPSFKKHTTIGEY